MLVPLSAYELTVPNDGGVSPFPQPFCPHPSQWISVGRGIMCRKENSRLSSFEHSLVISARLGGSGAAGSVCGSARGRGGRSVPFGGGCRVSSLPGAGNRGRFRGVGGRVTSTSHSYRLGFGGSRIIPLLHCRTLAGSGGFAGRGRDFAVGRGC